MAVATGTTKIEFQMKDAGTPAPLSAARVWAFQLPQLRQLRLTGPCRPRGVLNRAYAGSVAASGGAGALTYSLSSGASRQPEPERSNGSVTGTTTAGGAYTSPSWRQTPSGLGDSPYQIVVTSPLLSITPGPGSLPVAVTGQAYSKNAHRHGGTATGYAWTVSGLSNGLTSSASAERDHRGPATAAGAVNFTASAKDTRGERLKHNFLQHSGLQPGDFAADHSGDTGVGGDI